MLKNAFVFTALLLTTAVWSQTIDEIAARVGEAVQRLDASEAPESVKVRARVLNVETQFAGELNETLSQRAAAVIEQSKWTWDRGGVVRGDRSQQRIALVFTGGHFGEGAESILDALKERDIQAGFFVTGDYTTQEALHSSLRRMVAEGHYLGPHSHAHLLYAPWENRNQTLVTQEQFTVDLMANITTLRWFGALTPEEPILFIPPYEWYNADQVRWSEQMGIQLFNFTTGSGSNRDYAPEGHTSFVPSRQILTDILAFEERETDHLNGFILLLHLGSGREDPMHPLVGELIDTLRERGYEFIRIDEMLPASAWQQP